MKNILLIIVCLLGMSVSGYSQVSVIANKSVGESSLSASKVSAIFSLDQTKWGNGGKIVVIDNSSEAKSGFYSGIGKDALSMKKEWMKKQLTGEAKAPESHGSDAEIIAKVASTPGAVSFVKSSSVAASVKVLLELK